MNGEQLFVYYQHDLAIHCRLLDEFMGTRGLGQRHALRDDWFDLLLRQQIEQLGQVFAEPIRLLLAQRPDGIELRGAAIGEDVPDLEFDEIKGNVATSASGASGAHMTKSRRLNAPFKWPDAAVT